ncbi:MAG: nuclear transport factor 2 family protein [Proteobacteria bacterium]|nr:nuclear transport factor 2 family protein [Pseudomonadota bacterium]HQR03192.1 nuclear transport factor 2 family protein [Rhodocyclaceae bacterium]
MTTLSDERTILNGLGDFARILDRKQWDRVGEVFAIDVSFNYGDGKEQQGIEAMRQQFRTFLDRCGPTQHLLGSIQIEWEGNQAISRSYVQARHQGKDTQSHLYVDTSGEYTDRWERRAEGWRIVRRDARWDIFKGDPAVLYGA